jgi:hypothetical protein
MRILTGTKIHQAILEVRPSQIAVAYVGADWRTYLGESVPNEVIISPTFGSFPRAINEIAEELGWKNVHLLRELHAKIYLGETSAVVGSSNLTKNGLSGTILEEVGVLLDDDQPLQDLRDIYASLRERAQQQFPTEEAKQAEVKRLMRDWRIAAAEGIIASPSKELSNIVDFTLSDNNGFHVAWYRPDPSVKLDADAIPVSEDVIEDWTVFLEDDDQIENNQWLLLWAARNDGLPNLAIRPTWMYVHEVISNAVQDNPYSKVALQRRDKLPGDNPPFHIGKPEAAALHAVLASREFPELLPEEEKPWSLTGDSHRLEQFITAVKAAVRQRM